MRRGSCLSCFCLLIALAACTKPQGSSGSSEGTARPPQSSTQVTPRIYSGTLPFQGSVSNPACKTLVPVSGSLAMTVELDDTPTIEATGTRDFGPTCFTHNDALFYEGELTKLAEGQYRYRREGKNDTLQFLVTLGPGADEATVRYDNQHHCCGNPGEGNEGPQSGSAVLTAVR